MPEHSNDHIYVVWQKFNLLCLPHATLAPQARQASASGENLNYMTLAPKQCQVVKF